MFISFPMESFYEMVEDIEDISYLEGLDEGEDRETTPHEEVLKESGITPDDIKEIRKERGLTQKQLAEKIGYSEGTLRNIESGQNKISPRFRESFVGVEKVTT
ncbi:MAG: helix-turn-helix domain-containing protein [Proteobacteria bacterium]|nr:helix-turn-helix domain-containing protein [Pseudomonadota bacterium]